MNDNSGDSEKSLSVREEHEKNHAENESREEYVDKDFIPHFFPTFTIRRKLYPLPIIVVVAIAGLLSYLTYVEAGIQIDGGYVSEEEYGAMAGLLNGIIYTAIAALSSFIIIFLVKKKGIDVLKYVFGFSFAILGFFLTLFFGEILIYLIYYNLPASELIYLLYNITYYILLFGTIAFTILMLYKYFTSKSIFTKNFVVLYIGLLTGALMGVIMPLWTTLAILIGISLWDIFAVKSKRGPIKEMIDIASDKYSDSGFSKEDLQDKMDRGEIMYDTSKLEIGIGDLAFYSMLTSSALIQSNLLIVMISTSIAIIIGTGITISGLKRNKILPGLPISIFIGIATMLLSWYIVNIFVI